MKVKSKCKLKEKKDLIRLSRCLAASVASNEQSVMSSYWNSLSLSYKKRWDSSPTLPSLCNEPSHTDKSRMMKRAEVEMCQPGEILLCGLSQKNLTASRKCTLPSLPQMSVSFIDCNKNGLVFKRRSICVQWHRLYVDWGDTANWHIIKKW